MPRAEQLAQPFERLLAAYGPQGWWPGETALEVVVGAILTQNTNWRNVERAIQRLRDAGALDWPRLNALTHAELAELIRPAGTYNVKARRLKNFVEFFYSRYGGDWNRLAGIQTDRLREELLGVAGIGRETADAILLYALGRPNFVVDAYTRRIFVRHHLVDLEADYEIIKALVEEGLPGDANRFNEMHALLVKVGKLHCRPRALCAGCPLECFPHDAQADIPAAPDQY